jgi:hypothetical protein
MLSQFHGNLANMKVITAIYLHCRPDLRDEWLTGADIDADVGDSLVCQDFLTLYLVSRLIVSYQTAS